MVYLSLPSKVLLTLFPCFNQVCNFSTDSHKNTQYQISRQSVQWDPRWYVRTERRTQTDGRTNMTMVTGDFLE